MYDIIIVGGGPAGLTAAIYVCRAGEKCVVFEKSLTGGMINNSAKVENIPGFTEITGPEFSLRLTEQAECCGAEIAYEEVESVIKDGNIFRVKTECGDYEAISVIIAVGTEHRRLGLPNESKFIGNGIHFCALCDGAFYRNRNVVVIGGGNSALTEAIYLSGVCSNVTILQNLPRLTGDSVLIDKISSLSNVEVITNCSITNYNNDGNNITGIEYEKDGHSFYCACDGIFLCVGLVPNSDPSGLLNIGINGYYYKPGDVPGLYVAGDCAADTHIKQVAIAAASGAHQAVLACGFVGNWQN